MGELPIEHARAEVWAVAERDLGVDPLPRRG
jgi:hypothetical protein